MKTISAVFLFVFFMIAFVPFTLFMIIAMIIKGFVDADSPNTDIFGYEATFE